MIKLFNLSLVCFALLPK